MKENKIFSKKISLLFFLFGLFWAKSALAICPVCTIAVSACVGLAQYLGIDDTITGVWIGGLIISASLWTINYLENKNWNFKGHKITIVLFYYAIIIMPLYFKGIIGHPFNEIWTFDKLVVGIIFGSVFFLISVVVNSWLKKKNENRAYFPFQKVIIPLAALGILSAVFYFITC